jgi:hypothetical protein
MAFDQMGPTAQPSYHRLRRFATALTALFAVIIGLGVLLAGAHVWRGSVFDRRADSRLIEDVLVSEAEVDAAEAVVVTVSIVWWLLAAVTAVVFIVWQFRHAQNARTLGAAGGLAHPAWAIGAWFVPIGNVVLVPRQIYRCRAPGVGVTTLVVRAITWWAMALVLAGLIRWLALRIWVDGAEYRYDLLANSTADYLNAIAMLISAAAAVCALYIVRTLTRAQDEVLESRLIAGGSSQGPVGS